MASTTILDTAHLPKMISCHATPVDSSSSLSIKKFEKLFKKAYAKFRNWKLDVEPTPKYQYQNEPVPGLYTLDKYSNYRYLTYIKGNRKQDTQDLFRRLPEYIETIKEENQFYYNQSAISRHEDTCKYIFFSQSSTSLPCISPSLLWGKTKVHGSRASFILGRLESLLPASS